MGSPDNTVLLGFSYLTRAHTFNPKDHLDYYQLLGLDRRATDLQIRDAWRSAMRRNHPDLGINPIDIAQRTAVSARLNLAYQTLSTRRDIYDFDLAAAERPKYDSAAYAQPEPEQEPEAKPAAARPANAPRAASAATTSVEPSQSPLQWLIFSPAGQWTVLALGVLFAALAGYATNHMALAVNTYLSALLPLALLQVVLAHRWRDTPLAYAVSRLWLAIRTLSPL